MVKGAFLIPVFNAGELLRPVVTRLNKLLRDSSLGHVSVVIIDDGSTDDGVLACRDDALVLRHRTNEGKGAALRTGLRWAEQQGLDVVVSLDADGQHPPDEAYRLLSLPVPKDTLVLAVRDMVSAGAPLANQRSNRFSNFALSLMCGKKLLDTQCGLRRYPVRETLALGCLEPGYAFEADVLLRGARRGMRLHHESTTVIYPPENERVTYFDSVRDPARIVRCTLKTTLLVPHARPIRRWAERLFLAVLISLPFYWLS